MLNLYPVYSASNVSRFGLCALLCPAISFLHFHVLHFHVRHFHVQHFQRPPSQPISNRPNPTQTESSSIAVQLQCAYNYFQTSITVPRMHVKIIANMRHKSEHSINIKLASITCRSSCHRTSSTASQGSCGSLKVLELDFLTRRDRTSDCYHQMRFLGCNATELR